MRAFFKSFVLLFVVLLFAGCSLFGTSKLPVDVVDPLTYAVEQYGRTSSTLDPARGLPRTTNPDGSWKVVPSRDWTSGFYPGALWYLFEYSGDERFREQAERWTAEMEGEKQNRGTHDLGFMISNSFGNGYRLTGNTAYKEVILEAAESLASRYNPRVGAIKSWDWNPEPPQWQFPVIIDNMMNLEMLFWAAKNGGHPELAEKAKQHALTTLQHHVRPDGSTFHLVDFDTTTGRPRRAMTWQGYADSSAWARGQAWALYGFATVYRDTRDERFLDAARRVADFFIDHLPPDYVPFWDFRAPNIPDEKRDASAAAIAASGLLELSTLVPDRQGERYFDTAERMLGALGSDTYLTRGSRNDALLRHSVGFLPAESEVDVPLIYADYYFIEALLRYRTLKSQ